MPSAYRFDPILQQYRDSRGRFVAQTTPQQALTTSLAKLSTLTDQLAAELRFGNITLAAWRVEMQTIIKQVHAAGAALAHGGFDALTEEDVARLEETITREYLYLEAWAADLASGDAPMDGRLASRARLYVAGGRVTYHAERAVAAAAGGFDEVRSILTEAEHCDLCVEQDDLDWQPVEDFVPIGQRTCLGNDKCKVEYRRSGRAEERLAVVSDALAAPPAIATRTAVPRRQQVRRRAPPISAASSSAPTAADLVRHETDVFETTATFRGLVDDAVNGLPERLRALLAERGVRIQTGRLVTDMDPSLGGLVPPGWEGHPVDDLTGLHLTKGNRILMAERTGEGQPLDRIPGVLRHEVGHAMDQIFGTEGVNAQGELLVSFRSDAADFRTAYQADRLRIPVESGLSYYFQSGSAGQRETFAEAFGILLGGGGGPWYEDKFRRQFPTVMRLVEREVAHLKAGAAT